MRNKIVLTFTLYIAQPAVEYTNCSSAEIKTPPTNECPGFDTKQSEGEVRGKWGFGNAELPFITIAPRSPLAWIGSIRYGRIYGWNRTNCILMLKLICLN